MAILFTQIMQEAIRRGVLTDNNIKATSWFREEAQKISAEKADPQKVIKENKASLKLTITVGKLYLFQYDPKLKEELPYYDTFPLVFPFKKVSDGFLGINMHYLPYDLRAKLMDGLYSIAETKVATETRLKLSYQLLSSASRLRYFKPCVKHYLNSHIKSRFFEINSPFWDMALFLPLERFQKANKQTVFRDSRKLIKRQ